MITYKVSGYVSSAEQLREALSSTLVISGARLSELVDGLPHLRIEPRVGNGLQVNEITATIAGYSNVSVSQLAVAIQSGGGLAFNGNGELYVNAVGSGDVAGPASATDNALVRFDGTTGKLIQNSLAILSDTGALSLVSVTTRPAATQDGVILQGRAGGTGTYAVTISPTTLTASRTLTLADGDTILVAGTMVPTTRTLTIANGTGITGGGAAVDLSANRSWTIALTGQALALHNLASNGLIARTGAATVAARTITGTANQITVTNGDGVAANPTLSLPADVDITTSLDVGSVGAISAAAVRVGGDIRASGTIYANDFVLTGGAGGGTGISLDNLDDVVLTGPITNGQILQYNGSSWVNATAQFGSQLTVYEETTSLTSNATSLKFVGSLVTATNVGSDITVTISAPVWSDITSKPTTLSGFGITDAQPLDADLTAIAALAGTSGFLTKTAANSWALDTNTYLTGNQTVTLSGEATGSGATAITVTLSNAAVIGKLLTGYAVGTNTALAATDSILAAFQKVQGQINNRLPLSGGTITGTVTVQAAATQDAVRLQGRAGGTGSFVVTLTPTTLTASRTVTLADGDTILVAGTMVPTTRTLTIANGTGITGGGAAVDLSANRSWTIALTGQALALHNLASNGLIARTAANTVAARTITGTANQITVTNGDGVAGNPTLSLPADVDITTSLDIGTVTAIDAAALRVGGDIRASGTIYASDFVLTGGVGSGTGISLDNLDDVVITSPSNGQILQYNGTNWVNISAQFGSQLTVFEETTALTTNASSLKFVGGLVTATNVGNDITITIATPSWSDITSKPTTLSGFGITDAQPLDADLTAIAALAGTSGFLKKTAADTWTLDTNTYITGNQTITLSGGATGSGTTAITVTLSNTAVTGQALTGYVAGTNTALAATDTILQAFQKLQGQVSARITGNQTITLSGDATGSGTTAITVTLANSGVTAGTYRSVTVDVKGRVTAGTNPTTLSGYGITDALSNSTTSTQSGYFGDIFLYDDSTPSHYLGITNSANLTAARTLSLNVNDADRTISLSGNLTVSAAATISGTNTGDQTTITGNAGTATTLQTARTLWGNSFNGSANLTGALWLQDGGSNQGRIGATGYHDATYINANLYYAGSGDVYSAANWRYIRAAGVNNIAGGLLMIKGNGAEGGTQLSFFTVPTSTAADGSPASLTLRWRIDGAGVMTVGTSADIGTVTGISAAALRVGGDIRASGTIYASDFVLTGGAGGGTGISLDNLDDVVITAPPAAGEYLRYNGTNWVDSTIQTADLGSGTANTTTFLRGDRTWAVASLVGVLDDLTDVVVSSPANGHLLYHNGTNWVNGANIPRLGLDGVSELDTATLTTSATTANQLVMSLSATTYRSVKYQIQVVSGTAYQVSELLLVHDGTTAHITEYGIVRTGSNLATFDADISGGNIRLLVTPANAVTTIKVTSTAITA